MRNATQLFGTEAGNGLAEFAVPDANGDGMIDAGDPLFDRLAVWIDLNGDGMPKANEHESLKGLGVTEIKLNVMQATPDSVEDSQVSGYVELVLADGETRDIYEVKLNVTGSPSSCTGTFHEDGNIQSLPDTQGSGCRKGRSIDAHHHDVDRSDHSIGRCARQAGTAVH